MSHPQEVRRRPVDRPFRLSVPLGTIDHEGHDKKSTPERRSHAIAQGPRRHVKGHDRLVNIVHPTGDTPPPPACPTCGEPADRSAVRRQVGTLIGDYLCPAGHIWTTRWMEVA